MTGAAFMKFGRPRRRVLRSRPWSHSAPRAHGWIPDQYATRERDHRRVARRSRRVRGRSKPATTLSRASRPAARSRSRPVAGSESHRAPRRAAAWNVPWPRRIESGSCPNSVRWPRASASRQRRSRADADLAPDGAGLGCTSDLRWARSGYGRLEQPPIGRGELTGPRTPTGRPTASETLGDRGPRALQAPIELLSSRGAAFAQLCAGTEPSPGRLPSDPGWDGRRIEAVRGLRTSRDAPAQMVTVSLPYRQAGYTIRSRETLRAQRDAGLEPFVVHAVRLPAPTMRFPAAGRRARRRDRPPSARGGCADQSLTPGELLTRTATAGGGGHRDTASVRPSSRPRRLSRL